MRQIEDAVEMLLVPDRVDPITIEIEKIWKAARLACSEILLAFLRDNLEVFFVVAAFIQPDATLLQQLLHINRLSLVDPILHRLEAEENVFEFNLGPKAFSITIISISKFSSGLTKLLLC